MQTSSPSGAWEVRERLPTTAAVTAVPAASTAEPLNPGALCMSLRDWLALIPDYDGRASRLEGFAEAVRHVAARLGPSRERSLLLALGGKLRGRARVAFEHRLHRQQSLDGFLERLAARFSGAGAAGLEAALLTRLRSARQRNRESVEEFGRRVEELTEQLNAIYEGSAETEESRRRLGELALSSFRRGLASLDLEMGLGAWEPRSLEEAVDAALTVERELGARQELVRSAWAGWKKRCRQR